MPRRLTQRICSPSFLLLAACTLGAGSDGRAGKDEDPIGAWKLKCVSPDGKDRECVVTLFRDGKTLKATYRADGETRAAKDVVFEKGVLSFRVDGTFAGQVYGLTYNGKPQGGILKGTVRWSYGWAKGSFAFRGERLVEQVVSSP
jgi:hypothetical protein